MRLSVINISIIILAVVLIVIWVEFKIKKSKLNLSIWEYSEFDFDSLTWFQKRRLMKKFVYDGTINNGDPDNVMTSESMTIFKQIPVIQQKKVINYVEHHPVSCMGCVDVNDLYKVMDKTRTRESQKSQVKYVDRF